MKKDQKDDIRVLYLFSEEKIKEFKDLPLESRLRWLEEANRFINTFLGFKKRAITDPRFKDLPEE
ncbi:MAG: hypothetical protein D6778_00490 [Nitrospirae bacterium]|nr:MAG: hypothetical protein D6778_00490 [Nitrospirota bacterium]